MVSKMSDAGPVIKSTRHSPSTSPLPRSGRGRASPASPGGHGRRQAHGLAASGPNPLSRSINSGRSSGGRKSGGIVSKSLDGTSMLPPPHHRRSGSDGMGGVLSTSPHDTPSIDLDAILSGVGIPRGKMEAARRGEGVDPDMDREGSDEMFELDAELESLHDGESTTNDLSGGSAGALRIPRSASPAKLRGAPSPSVQIPRVVDDLDPKSPMSECSVAAVPGPLAKQARDSSGGSGGVMSPPVPASSTSAAAESVSSPPVDTSGDSGEISVDSPAPALVAAAAGQGPGQEGISSSARPQQPLDGLLSESLRYSEEISPEEISQSIERALSERMRALERLVSIQRELSHVADQALSRMDTTHLRVMTLNDIEQEIERLSLHSHPARTLGIAGRQEGGKGGAVAPTPETMRGGPAMNPGRASVPPNLGPLAESGRVPPLDLARVTRPHQTSRTSSPHSLAENLEGQTDSPRSTMSAADAYSLFSSPRSAFDHYESSSQCSSSQWDGSEASPRPFGRQHSRGGHRGRPSGAVSESEFDSRNGGARDGKRGKKKDKGAGKEKAKEFLRNLSRDPKLTVLESSDA